MDVDLGWAALTSLSALGRVRHRLRFDSDLTPAASSHSIASVDINMFTQDLTFVSSIDGPLSFILGGSYYRESDTVGITSSGGLSVPNPNPPLTLVRNADVDVKAWAMFGEVSYAFSDRVKLTGGLRWTTETPGFVARTLNLTTGVYGAPVPSNPASNSKFTPRASLQVKLSDNLNSYFTYSRGFKSGVVNPLAAQVVAASPETVDAFELGLKGVTSLAFSFETAAFYYKYKNLQFQAFGVNTITPILRNAAAAEVYGFEANATVRPVEDLRFRAGVAYTHGKYTSFTNAQVYRPLRDALGNILGGNISTNEDVSGNPLIRTPRWQANGTITYATTLGNGGGVEANLTGSYNGARTFDVAGVFNQGGFAIFNANLSYRTSDGHWKGTVYGTNIFNSLPIASLQPSGTTTGVFYWQPAVYGARIEFSF
jgi:iron complex outermembrane recepter protein